MLERCPGFDTDMLEPNRNSNIVQKRQEEFLTDKQLVDYYEYRKKFLTYLLRMGKNPQKANGYSPYTVKNTADLTARNCTYLGGCVRDAAVAPFARVPVVRVHRRRGTAAVGTVDRCTGC